jgi:GTP-binding protein
LIDRVELEIKAGDGGGGGVGFRHEKYVPFGGPDGGDGGNGGSIYIFADRGMKTLQKFYRGGRNIYAEQGENGASKKRHGKSGRDLRIMVPTGTLIYRNAGGERYLLADLTEDGQQVMVAQGGSGGYGNARFRTSTNRTPRIAQKGEVGEETSLILELKLIADVGIIGYPSVGKSTLLAAATEARPRVADYPFTTTEPVLGVVEVGQSTFVLAEIPGLIEGAHRGRGLGHDFLRHAERTRVLIHLLDGGSDSPLSDMDQVNDELSQYNPVLAEKPQLIVVNKIDIPHVRGRIPELERELGQRESQIFFISAASTEGVHSLMARAYEVMDTASVPQPPEAPTVFRPRPKRERVIVSREGDTFVVLSDRAERVLARMDLDNPEARSYVRRQLTGMGVVGALKRAGVKPGDRVLFGKMEMIWE